MWTQQVLNPDAAPLLTWQGLRVFPGLNAVTGDEGSGKTSLLRTLANGLGTDALWLDLRLPEHEAHTPHQVWSQLQVRCPRWNEELRADLADALDLKPHLDKQLFMLSTGSRRKVALAGLLASGVVYTCIDQPYAALDWVSVRVMRDFFDDMAGHTERAWIIADYEADPELPWQNVIASHNRSV